MLNEHIHCGECQRFVQIAFNDLSIPSPCYCGYRSQMFSDFFNILPIRPI